MNNLEKYSLDHSLVQAFVDHAHVLMLMDELLWGLTLCLGSKVI